MTRHGHFNLIFIFCAGVVLVCVLSKELERHPNDGWYNNLMHPDWGAIDTQLLRRSLNAYSDGVYEPAGKTRPNPFDISDIAFKGNSSLGSLRGRNALLVFFGQQLVEEIMDAQRPACPVEYYNIKVPKDHQYNPDKKDDLEMPFQRARFDQRTGYSPNNPRQQLNEITPYLDGNLVYGTGKSVEDTLREFNDGRLLATSDIIKESLPAQNDIRLPYANPPAPRDHFLRPVSRFRRYGNPRTHENPFLTALAVVWFRYHNYIAQEVKKKNSSLNDEQIFNAARKRVIAQYQKIVMYEWLPIWLSLDSKGNKFNISAYPYKGGEKNKYAGYDPNVHPGITMEFQAAALRYGHTLVPSGVKTKRIKHNVCTNSKRNVKAKFTTKSDNDKDSDVEVEGIRLCNSFWLPEETLEYKPGVDESILGMIFTRSAREDNIIVSDIRENVFGPLDWSRRDVAALNIQRGRDLGLPGYNDVRVAFKLERLQNWTAINPEYSKILRKLQAEYGYEAAPDNLDLFPGGLLETTLDGPGPLFREITLDQFLRIRHGDRFWYENEGNGLFTEDEVKEIDNTTFCDVLKSVTGALDDSGKIANIGKDVFICVSGTDPVSCKCVDPAFDEAPIREKCVPLQHYDYFSGSEVSFVVTIIVIILSVPVTIGAMLGLAHLRKNSLDAVGQVPWPKYKPGPNEFYATEWVGRTAFGHLNSREVKISLDNARLKMLVSSMRGQVVRMINLRHRITTEGYNPRASITRSNDKGHKLLILAVPGEIDLVLHFQSRADRESSYTKLQEFFTTHGWNFYEGHNLAENVMWREAMTVDQRKEVLTKFFKSAVEESSEHSGVEEESQDNMEEVLATKLTRTEFADALGLQPHSLFVRNMFLLVDSSGDGFISFDEFKTYFGILHSGQPEEKAEMIFRMFDTSRSGRLTKEHYKKMIRSLLELNETGGSKLTKINDLVDAVFKQVGRHQDGYLTLEDFKSVILADTNDVWKSAVFNLDVAGESIFLGNKRGTMRDRANTFVNEYMRASSMVAVKKSLVRLPSKIETVPKNSYAKLIYRWTRYVNNHRRQIFWVTLYTLVTLGIFIERAHHYSFKREHAGLRRLAGYGVSVTRGAASAQMFTYASLLVTMCRNTLTMFRETFLHRFIPFDNAHDMHIYVAALAMFFTVIHVIGHLLNFYHICTQASLDLNCYFREFFRPTHVLASFHYWTYQTVTGLTGVVLIFVLVVLYVFSVPYARRHVFKYFKTTHNLYILVYILLFLHGAARLVQSPLWSYYFLGPMVLFILDKLVSVSRNKVLLPVHKAKLLPSGVINLVFKRPTTFNYQSGQWVRIACPELGKGEYHPFTLTSAPHEEHLSLHIRALGPWTTNICKLFDYNSKERSIFRKIYLDGPFGESHQDWYRYPVSVLIGGGIGVTPFASILKDIAHRANSIGRLPCQKVYFIWVTRTQQSFEWMTDIIRQVEAADTADYVDARICITEMKERFDLRTTLLYICERHFQKIAGVSMFTGLRAKTHFGRPKFQGFFKSLKVAHDEVGQIGVFSCGPPSMTSTVQQACTEQNAFTGPSLIHHFENF